MKLTKDQFNKTISAKGLEGVFSKETIEIIQDIEYTCYKIGYTHGFMDSTNQMKKVMQK